MLSNVKTATKDENIKFEELTKEWLLYKKHQIKESSYFRYKYIINKYLLDIFDGAYINEFENIDINVITDELLNRYNIKTVRSIILELKSILIYSEKKYMLNFRTDLIVIPKTDYKEIKILEKKDEENIKKFCFKSTEPRDIGLILCLYTGMRIGEVCALTWKNIDLDNNLIHINKTMERLYRGNKNTMIYIGEPKSKSSIRTVPIVDNVCDMLRQIKSEKNIDDNMFFLSGSNTRFIEPRNYQYWFRKRLKQLNIPLNKFHILRHTFATNCIRIGMDIKSLSELLGHSNVSITLDRYVHSSYELKKQFLEKL